MAGRKACKRSCVVDPGSVPQAKAETLLRRDSVEPWVVDADMQPAILAWMGSYARQTVVVAYDYCFLNLLSGLGDELLRVGSSLPHAFLREMC